MKSWIIFPSLNIFNLKTYSIVRSLFFLSLIILGSCLNPLNGHCQWTWQNPLPHGNSYNDIQLLNHSTGFAAGEYGQLWKTTNGGANWQKINLGTTKNINTIFFINPNTGWLCGDDSLLMNTTDGGLNWNIRQIGCNGRFSDVYFADINIGFVAAAGTSTYILRTTNSGLNWSIVSTTNNQTSGKFYFCDSVSGYIPVGYYWNGGGSSQPYTTPGMLTTTNKGASWSFNQSALNFSTYQYMRVAQFFNTNTGIISASLGNAIKTTNAGANWATYSYSLYTMKFYNRGSYGYLGYNKISISTNAGESFAKADSNYPVKYYALDFVDSSNVWFVGTGGFVIRTSNAGATFVPSNDTKRTGLNSICVVTSNVSYTCGNNGIILKTTNSGTNWSAISSGYFSAKTLYNINFLNENTGFVCADSFIAKTTDAGNNWAKKYVSISSSGDYVRKTVFLNYLTGYSASNTFIRKTTDAGETWNLLYTNTNGVKLILLKNGVMFSYNMYDIRKSTDGGLNWSIIFSGPLNVWSGDFSDQYHGCFCFYEMLYPANYSFSVKVTTDGGNSWTLSAAEKCDLIYAYNNNEYLYSNSNKLLKTGNGGLNWTNTNINGNKINSLLGYGKDVYAVGDYGMIMKGTDMYTTDVENTVSNLPDRFSLSQNFPNPFNPVSKIKYQVPQLSAVNISVYDLTGRLIVTLVDKRLAAGTYETVFDGAGFSSGVYFCRITASDERKNVLFSDVKKMILLK